MNLLRREPLVAFAYLLLGLGNLLAHMLDEVAHVHHPLIEAEVVELLLRQLAESTWHPAILVLGT
jgi:hypothetical protein